MSEAKKLFRYTEDRGFEFFGQVKELLLKEYLIIKETPKGNWIREHGNYGKPKFCLKGEGKRFAHETKELALKSFICRKQRQYQINKGLMKSAKHYLYIAEAMTI